MTGPRPGSEPLPESTIRPGLVSVITIFLDAAAFLVEAMESVVAQDYPAWELLLVDDGSTDEGSDMAREYARRRPEQIRYFAHPKRANVGMSASRALGIRHARGEFIAFLDADDVWMPEKLSRQVALLESFPEAAMTYGPALYWHSWTGERADVDRDFIQPLAFSGSRIAAPPSLVPEWLCRPFATPGTSGSLVRTTDLRRTAPSHEFRALYEDQVLFCKIGLTCSIVPSDVCLYKYRQHEHSCCSMARHAASRAEARLAFLRWLERYLDERAITDRAVRSALARELRAQRTPSALAASGRGLARALFPPSVRGWIRSLHRG